MRPFHLLAILMVAEAYSPRPTSVSPAIQASLAEAGDCGKVGMPACLVYNETTGMTAHACYSDSHPTIGAVQHSIDGPYVCEMCGVPNRHACECTHDNPSSYDPFSRPCATGLAHWCFFEPQVRSQNAFAFTCDWHAHVRTRAAQRTLPTTLRHAAQRVHTQYIVAQMDDGLYWCKPNGTDADPQRSCGTEGHEACLDTATNTYTCASPAPDGAEVRAYPIGKDASTATQMCVRCGVVGACVIRLDRTPSPFTPARVRTRSGRRVTPSAHLLTPRVRHASPQSRLRVQRSAVPKERRHGRWTGLLRRGPGRERRRRRRHLHGG